MDIVFIHNEADLNSSNFNREAIIDFLYTHLDRFRDSKEAINEAIDYAFSESDGKGGFIAAGIQEEKLVCALLMIQTGMKKYIPENILVYVAVDSDHRGKGIGGKVIEKSIEHCRGNVALHVEYDNPAKHLYERLGFTSKYAEMRFER